MILQLKLYNDSLTIKHISNSSRFHNSGDECPYSPSHIGSIRPTRVAIRDGQLKKNYNLIAIERGNYMIYNQKNQAIIDTSILGILNRFERQEINQNPKLLNILYRLEFVVNG